MHFMGHDLWPGRCVLEVVFMDTTFVQEVVSMYTMSRPQISLWNSLKKYTLSEKNYVVGRHFVISGDRRWIGGGNWWLVILGGGGERESCKSS